MGINFRQILFQKKEPELHNVLWLNMIDKKPILKVFNNGEWQTIAGGSGNSVQSDWNTTNSKDASFIKNKPNLKEYALKTEVDQAIQNINLSNYVEKEEGKGLSSNDFTKEYIDKIEYPETVGTFPESTGVTDITSEDNENVYVRPKDLLPVFQTKEDNKNSFSLKINDTVVYNPFKKDIKFSIEKSHGDNKGIYLANNYIGGTEFKCIIGLEKKIVYTQDYTSYPISFTGIVKILDIEIKKSSNITLEEYLNSQIGKSVKLLITRKNLSSTAGYTKKGNVNTVYNDTYYNQSFETLDDYDYPYTYGNAFCLVDLKLVKYGNNNLPIFIPEIILRNGMKDGDIITTALKYVTYADENKIQYPVYLKAYSFENNTDNYTVKVISNDLSYTNSNVICNTAISEVDFSGIPNSEIYKGVTAGRVFSSKFATDICSLDEEYDLANTDYDLIYNGFCVNPKNDSQGHVNFIDKQKNLDNLWLFPWGINQYTCYYSDSNKPLDSTYGLPYGYSLINFRVTVSKISKIYKDGLSQEYWVEQLVVGITSNNSPVSFRRIGKATMNVPVDYRVIIWYEWQINIDNGDINLRGELDNLQGQVDSIEDNIGDIDTILTEIIGGE